MMHTNNNGKTMTMSYIEKGNGIPFTALQQCYIDQIHWFGFEELSEKMEAGKISYEDARKHLKNNPIRKSLLDSEYMEAQMYLAKFYATFSTFGQSK